ncbi:hypothetical protein MKX01_009690, partial [Papaver californicum]
MGENVLDDANNMGTYTHFVLDVVQMVIPPQDFIGDDDLDLDVNMLLEDGEAAGGAGDEVVAHDIVDILV